jgi:Tfp pilus assembly pilus retraction ATPase PilT
MDFEGCECNSPVPIYHWALQRTLSRSGRQPILFSKKNSAKLRVSVYQQEEGIKIQMRIVHTHANFNGIFQIERDLVWQIRHRKKEF